MMEFIIPILGVIGVVFAILANLTSIFKFTQEQRDRKRKVQGSQPSLVEDKVVVKEVKPEQKLEPSQDDDLPRPNEVIPMPTQTILTPDQRLRVFVSSTLQELADEREAVKAAITALHLSPVMFENLGQDRIHPESFTALT
jgi:Domain of unknown function (DUF4062)